jgi:hypothetical protein
LINYLEGSVYIHPAAQLEAVDSHGEQVRALFKVSSFLLTSGYCAHRETRDNGKGPREQIKKILADWLTEERETQLWLKNTAVLNAAAEELSHRMYQNKR